MPQATDKEFIKAFGPNLRGQAVAVTVIAPFAFLAAHFGMMPANGALFIQLAIPLFWLVWLLHRRNSIVITVEGLTVRRNGERLYRWQDRPRVIWHTPWAYPGTTSYLEIARHDGVTDTLGFEVIDDAVLAEIGKHCEITKTKRMFPDHRVV
jgi:hypothetical protein